MVDEIKGTIQAAIADELKFVSHPTRHSKYYYIKNKSFQDSGASRRRFRFVAFPPLIVGAVSKGIGDGNSI